MIHIFIQHTPPALKEMESALNNKQYVTIIKTVHRIKPSIESMGISQLDGVARDIEVNAKEEKVDHNVLSHKVRFLTDTLSMVIRKLQKDYK
jgi:HPt (histidine-containing phosphotransfer) domain-containing protein